MDGALSAARAGLARAVGAAMALCLLALVLIDFAQVVMRYGLGTGWPWAGDLSVILLLTLAWLGAGRLWLDRSHIAVDLVPPGRAAAALGLAIDLLALLGALALLPVVTGAMALYGAIDLPALPLPASAKYAPVAAGLALLALAAALSVAARATGRR